MNLNDFLTECYENHGVRGLNDMRTGMAATAIGLWAREHAAAVAGGLCNRAEAIERLAIAVGDYYDAAAKGDRNAGNRLRADIAEFHLQPARTAASYWISQWFADRARMVPDLVDQAVQS